MTGESEGQALWLKLSFVYAAGANDGPMADLSAGASEPIIETLTPSEGMGRVTTRKDPGGATTHQHLEGHHYPPNHSHRLHQSRADPR